MLRIIITIFCLLGGAFSYFTVSDAMNWQVVGDNYVSSCQIDSFFDCRTVAESAYSSFGGFPNGVWGIIYFGTLFLIAVVAAKPRIALVVSLFGAAVSIWMLVVSFAIVGALCLWCCGIYALSLLLVLACYLVHRQNRDSEGDGNIIAEVKGILLGSGISIYRYGGLIVGIVLLCGFALTLPEELKKKVSYQDSPEIYLRSQIAKWRDSKRIILPDAKLMVASDASSIVTIHEFFDFQCPACQVMYRKLGELKEKYPITINYLNYPLSNKCNENLDGDFHANACDYAKIALCARGLGADVGAIMETLLFLKKSGDPTASIINILGKDRERELKECLDDKKTMEELKQEILLTKQFEMTGTPTILVNGRVTKVSDVAVLEEIIKAAMKE